MTHEEILKKIKSNIDTYIELGKKHEPNKIKSPQKKTRQEINLELEKASLYHYREQADEHYFYARIWLCDGILWYGLFAGQQAIELYLKSLFKLADPRSAPHITHSLIELRAQCMRSFPQNEFLKGQYAKHIIQFFDRFYEFGRYPILTKDIGSFGFISGDAIDYLDLFIYEMRKIVPIGNPLQEWDIFSDNWEDHPCFLHPVMKNKYHECFAKDNPNIS